MEGEIENQVCPFCAKPVNAQDYYCPHCGKKIREKQLSTTTLTQCGIYLLSFFLPPLGLWPAFRYLRQSDDKRKTIGFVAIALTILSVILTLILSAKFIDTLNTSINSQLQGYTF